MRDPILVWPFHEAPPAYQALSTFGGDEDWLAYLPASYRSAWDVPWLASGSAFGVSAVREYRLPDGDAVYIGAHA